MKALRFVFIVWMASLLTACPGDSADEDGNAGTTNTNTYSGSWNCGSQQQCAIVMGAASGCKQFTTLASCQSFFSNTTFGNSCQLGTCSTTPGSGPLSSISEILNGPNAAGQTSYWLIGGLGTTRVGSSSKFALFADGTGKLISVTNECSVPLTSGLTAFNHGEPCHSVLCTLPVDPPTTPVENPFANQGPVVTNFTWTATGPSALVFTDAAYHCLFDTWTNSSGNVLNLTVFYDRSPLTSMFNISGGISTGTLTATFVPGVRFVSPLGTGTLVSGAF